MKRVMRTFSVQGLNLERFINLACEAGLSISAMQKRGRTLRGRCDETDFDTLRSLAESGGWVFSMGGRYGSGKVLDALKKRYLLAAALVVAAGVACGLYQMVWQVELIDAQQYQADASIFLEENGVQPFTWKNSIDLLALRDALEWRYPQVAWIECGWRGTTLRIAFSQGVPQGETISHDGSGDVVAARDGIIESIVTVAGTPMVKVGDIVKQGQLLIKGEERAAEDQLIAVAARGVVKARVWDGAAVQMQVMEVQTTYTGEVDEVWVMSCPWFDLWQRSDSPFEQEDVSRSIMPVGGVFLPIWLICETRMEAEVTAVRRDQAQLEEEAGEAAMRMLLQKIGFGDDLVDKWVDCCMIEDEVLEAVAICERVIDIAVQRRSD